MTIELRKCIVCKLDLTIDKFIKIEFNTNICKSCQAEERREKRYGISSIDLNNLLRSQDGKCKICNKEILLGADIKRREMACIDHIEGTMSIRGLLCNNCNTGIGFFAHNLEIMLSAINYLKLPPVYIGNESLLYKSENKVARRAKIRNNPSGYLGVYLSKKDGKFMARIGVTKKLIYLGYYDYPEQAALAYDNYVEENIPNYQGRIILNDIPKDWAPPSLNLSF